MAAGTDGSVQQFYDSNTSASIGAITPMQYQYNTTGNTTWLVSDPYVVPAVNYNVTSEVRTVPARKRSAREWLEDRVTEMCAVGHEALVGV